MVEGADALGIDLEVINGLARLVFLILAERSQVAYSGKGGSPFGFEAAATGSPH